jgi:endonuclease/exonuclease/phosphatase family metal-dependent hydrolase
VIRSVQPDLVALQEVDQGTQRTNQVDQPAELARLTGMNVVFGGNIALPRWRLRQRGVIAAADPPAPEPFASTV